MNKISQADLDRIAFAQKLLDSGAMRSVRFDFNDPAFLTFARKHGFLKGNEAEMECFELHGKLFKDPVLEKKAQEFRIGAVLPGYAHLRALEKMSPKELAGLCERVTGVLPFRSSKSRV
jgi:hypothetical protein